MIKKAIEVLTKALPRGKVTVLAFIVSGAVNENSTNYVLIYINGYNHETFFKTVA